MTKSKGAASLLSSIAPTRNNRPPRVLFYGPHGIGKSTLGAQADSPVFLQMEEGLDALDASAFPVPATADEALDQILALTNEAHGFKSVVLDTADWLENKIHADIMAGANVTSLADVGGFGKGYKMADAKWREILAALDLCRDKGMAVIVLAHSAIVTVNNPATEPYDKYTPDLSKGARQLISEWADYIGFADYSVAVLKTEGGFSQTTRRGVGGERIIRLAPNPAWDAKARSPMPEEIPLSWAAFVEALEAGRGPATPAIIDL